MRCGMHDVLERRDKWDVDEWFELPILDDIPDDIVVNGEVAPLQAHTESAC
jgi:hypothetical protein